VVTIDPGSGVPLVEQVRRSLRRAIADGTVRVGDALPPVRQLAADLGVNLNTIARAYRELEREGLVSTGPGRGTFVAGDRDRAPVERARLESRLRDVVADARLAGYGPAALRALLSDALAGATS
jgi:DNA-binding transcriptional regulator YhcF (GntR family)